MYLSMFRYRSGVLASGLSVCLLGAIWAGCSNSTSTSNDNGPARISCDSSSTLPPFPVPQGPPAVTGGFAYAVRTTSHKVVWYQVESSGALSSRGEICAGLQPTFIAANSTRKLAYVTNFGSDTVSAYTIGTDGALAALGSPVPAGNGPASISVDWTRNFVYVTNFDSDTVSVYKIGSNGGLELVEHKPTGGGPDAIAINSTGTRAYVANFRADTISTYKINATTGKLEDVSVPNVPLATGLGPNAIAIHPTGSFLYVSNEENDTVSAYSIKTTGELQPLGGLVPVGNGPEGVMVDPTGKFAYVADGQGDTISIYTIDATTGALQAPGSSISTLPARDPEGIVMDPVTNTIYVVNRETRDVSAYKISNSTTGALSLVGLFAL